MESIVLTIGMQEIGLAIAGNLRVVQSHGIETRREVHMSTARSMMNVSETLQADTWIHSGYHRIVCGQRGRPRERRMVIICLMNLDYRVSNGLRSSNTVTIVLMTVIYHHVPEFNKVTRDENHSTWNRNLSVSPEHTPTFHDTFADLALLIRRAGCSSHTSLCTWRAYDLCCASCDKPPREAKFC